MVFNGFCFEKKQKTQQQPQKNKHWFQNYTMGISIWQIVLCSLGNFSLSVHKRASLHVPIFQHMNANLSNPAHIFRK